MNLQRVGFIVSFAMNLFLCKNEAGLWLYLTWFCIEWNVTSCPLLYFECKTKSDRLLHYGCNLKDDSHLHYVCNAKSDPLLHYCMQHQGRPVIAPRSTRNCITFATPRLTRFRIFLAYNSFFHYNYLKVDISRRY